MKTFNKRSELESPIKGKYQIHLFFKKEIGNAFNMYNHIKQTFVSCTTFTKASNQIFDKHAYIQKMKIWLLTEVSIIVGLTNIPIVLELTEVPSLIYSLHVSWQNQNQSNSIP